MALIQLGLVIPAEFNDRRQRATYTADVNRFLALASGHFTSAWMVDHLQFGDTEVLESFTALSFLAGLHPQFKFGQAVLCQSFRNPALVAKMGATLQWLSGGRFLLGMGAGWNEEEYRAYGYPFPPVQVRVAQLEEAIQVIRALWTSESANFNGQYYQVRDARCEPKPVPPPPLMVGAFKPKMLRLTAKYADEWNVSSSGVVRYRRLAAEFERACQAVGRDPATVRRSWIGGCACAATRAQAEALAGDRFSASADEDDFGFVGAPAQIIDQMRPFIELGVDRFILDCNDFPRTDGLERIIAEVLPGLG